MGSKTTGLKVKRVRAKTRRKDDALRRQPSARNLPREYQRTKHPPRVRITKQITVHLSNKPGEMARLARLLEKAGVNIIAISVSELADTGAVRIIPDNRAAARRALRAAGLQPTLRDVLLVRTENAPGALGAISATLAGANINVDYVYASSLPDAHQALLVLAVNNPREAAHALR